MGVGRPRAVEDPGPMNGAEVRQRVAESPAFLERCLESVDLRLYLRRAGCRKHLIFVVFRVRLGLSDLVDFCVFFQ